MGHTRLRVESHPNAAATGSPKLRGSPPLK